jgi:hypothetical protein
LTDLPETLTVWWWPATLLGSGDVPVPYARTLGRERALGLARSLSNAQNDWVRAFDPHDETRELYRWQSPRFVGPTGPGT